MAQYWSKAVSGNVYRNNGGAVVMAGNYSAADGRATTSLTMANNAVRVPVATPFLAVSVASSGNVGTGKAITGTFGRMTDGYYVGMMLTSQLAGASNTTLARPANFDHGRKAIAWSQTYRRLNITSWNHLTGAATKGANAGDSTDLGADHAAHPAYRSPGEFAYSYGNPTPSQADFPTRNG